ncbi:MAG: cytochrome c [Flavobacterium sp.]|nr:cytochrome c [Flavobacterium sp.]
MNTKILFTALLATTIFACGPKPEVPPPPPPASPVATVEQAKATTSVATAEVTEGKTSYENNCAKCHKLYAPSDYSKDDWMPILNRMAKKARLDDVETGKIYAYLSYNSK